MNQLVTELERHIVSSTDSDVPDIFLDPKMSLEAFAILLPVDRDIVELERLEALYKKLLRHIAQLNSLDLAYLVAKTQKEIGFILKYKSYGIKASTPLGFSIFFLEPGEGFSFQRHLDLKTEVFLFIAAKSNKSFAFLCDYSEWEENYRPDAFLGWLAGSETAYFDHSRYKPNPGDVLRIAEIGLVHSVLGCVMEEYANVSTDMVDRLHDQNKGKLIPQKFNREYFQSQLSNTQYPREYRLASRNGAGFIFESIKEFGMEGNKTISIMATEAYVAERIFIPPKGSWQFTTGRRYVSAYVSDGSAECRLIESNGLSTSCREFQLNARDVFLGLPRCNWRISNLSNHNLSLSVFMIDEDCALI